MKRTPLRLLLLCAMSLATGCSSSANDSTDDPKKPDQAADMRSKGDMSKDLGDDMRATVDMRTRPDMSADMTAPAQSGQLFSSSKLLWNQPISEAPKDARSDALIARLIEAGGWGLGRMQIDSSIEVLTADKDTPRRAFTKTQDFYEGACDHIPFPVPADGNLEGETGYACEGDGDCHLIVHEVDEGKLYEMWRADIRGQAFNGGCAAIWDTKKEYPDSLRGHGCTSADAAGLPIAALLFSADEVYNKEIPHAIRFILPNNRIKRTTFVRPATHGVGSGMHPDAMPYGVRLRLRADYPLETLPNDAARTVAAALQRYGMILSDGGNVALTAQSDRHTAHKWSEVGLESRDLQTIQVSDFEVVQLGEVFAYDGFPDCVRNP